MKLSPIALSLALLAGSMNSQAAQQAKRAPKPFLWENATVYFLSLIHI